MKPLTEENWAFPDILRRKLYIKPGFNPLCDDDQVEIVIKILTNKAGLIEHSKDIDLNLHRITLYFDYLTVDLHKAGETTPGIGKQYWTVNMEDLSFTPWPVKSFNQNQKENINKILENLKQLGN